ncbi:hypothetical protein [Pseudomonas serbica]|uniref:hypothetical protein n=1 Tax=Pseudomonas serbica TaxID=2965074 RepID=UPI00237AA1DE|nr:hypothetical protein [Pseudomonas serbica]
MNLADQEELQRQLSALKTAATGLELYLEKPDEEYSEESYDALLAGLIGVAADSLHLATKHREGLSIAVARRALQHQQVMEAGAAALEQEAEKLRNRGNHVGAEISINSARLVREKIQELTVNERRASLKLVR